MSKGDIQSILATDCGSTTTKAILIEKRDGVFRLIVRGEAPTTVEAPVEDVTQGVLNAVSEVQELAGRQILTDDGKAIIKPVTDGKGVDLYVSTSSAGGGLQMMVTGVVKTMSGESATRAALGAGAIVMDVLATNDGRLPYKKIQRIRHLRPDMILLSGGVDGGTTSHVVELAEIIAAANPKARLGAGYELPVLYAGNKDAQGLIKERLQDRVALDIADNLRPTLERENLMPTRQKIQHLFLEHVMSHAPGYPHLMELTDEDIMPTPGAVGDIMQLISKRKGLTVVGADIGGATTDVFSVFSGIYNKSVSANYGMSYSISNVFAEAGLDNIMRWVPFEMDERDLRNRVKNKMIRPTTIPSLIEELIVEQACAREALRLSFDQHRSLAVGLKGIQQERTIGDVFEQSMTGESLVNLKDLNMLIGSGGVLSHAPRRQQTAMMLIDSFLPEGITQLTVDSIFMMPQLGVLAKVHEEAALSVFERDCLIYLGTCVSPTGKVKRDEPVLDFTLTKADGSKISKTLKGGELTLVPLGVGETAKLFVKPKWGFDMGNGDGREMEGEVHGGVVGLIFDTRGRPFTLPKDNAERVKLVKSWYKAMDLYPGL
ncbi:MAG TPA: glutamate mutase L [Candidatus Rifleibacterium sp.]|nr:glutamate mutase L [Candidatus Rifleibacterium sp.]HPT47073.1 glutamate mutase L [Candidatus Rifleibacterium sp.]